MSDWLRVNIIVIKDSHEKEKGGHKDALFTFYISNYFPNLREACAAASLAIGTLKGEQLT